MAKAKLHKVSFTDLEILALLNSEPKEVEDGSMLSLLLNKAFFSAKETLEEVAKNEILPASVTAPSDEFDNPESITEFKEVVAELENGAAKEPQKAETKGKAKAKFEPSID